MKKDWQSIAEGQAAIIDGLSFLCRDLIDELAQFCDVDEEEKRLISDYARAFGISASEFMRKSALERIEDELDLEDWKRAKAEFDADPEMVSAAGVAKKHL